MHWTIRKLHRPHRITIRASYITLEQRRKYWEAKPGGRENKGGGGGEYILLISLKKEQLSRDCNGRYLQNDGLLKPALETQCREERKEVSEY